MPRLCMAPWSPGIWVTKSDQEKFGAVPSGLVVHRDDKRLAQSDELSAERGIKEISLIPFVLLP